MVLVTGGSGFVGRHLVAALASSGIPVRALYHKNKPGGLLQHLPSVTWVSCDLLDVFAVEDAFENVTEVYHAAAVVSFARKDRLRLMQVNVDASANVVNEALQRPIRKLLHFSSVAAIGRNVHQKTITEDEQWEESEFNSGYGKSKRLAELEIWRAAGEGLPVVVINPGIILGEPLEDKQGWYDGSARLMHIAYQEFPFYTLGVNAFVDVKDVVRLSQMLMASDLTNQRFIVSAGNYAYRDLFTEMAQALDKRPPYIYANKLMTETLWRWQALRRFLGGRAPTVTRETANTAQSVSLYDNRLLLQAFPEFKYSPVKETILRIARAYQRDHTL